MNKLEAPGVIGAVHLPVHGGTGAQAVRGPPAIWWRLTARHGSDHRIDKSSLTDAGSVAWVGPTWGPEAGGVSLRRCGQQVHCMETELC